MKYFCLILFLSLWAQAKLPPLNLTDWPLDVVERMRKEVPELNEIISDEEHLNLILKKIDQKMQFNSLKAIRLPNELRLVGEISAVVEKVEFQGLDDLSETEALAILNLNLKNAMDEDTLKVASDKLTQTYREMGYRFTEVKFEVISLSTIKKAIVFKINTKKKTRLTDIRLDGVDLKTKEQIEAQMKIFIFKPVLTQETLNRLNVELRRQLSLHGYYMTQVTSPQIMFSADELSARILYKLIKSNPFSVEIINAIQFPVSYLENDVLKLESYYTKDPNFGGDLMEKLKSFYISEGYPHIDIAYYERKEGQKIVMSYNLEEGVYTRLTRLNIVGQLSRDEKYYKKKFFSLASPMLENKTFIKEDIEAAAKNLLTDLQNEGFVSARLGRIQVGTDRENPKEGQATIQLDEGPQVTIDSIQFEGLVTQTKEQLQEIDLT